MVAVDIGTPRSRAGSGARSPSAQNPPSAAGPNAASAVPQSTVSKRGGDLRRVHPDQQRRAAYRGEGGGEALVERPAALGHDVEPGRQPGAWLTVEDQDPAPRGHHEDGAQGVGERGLGERAACS